MRQVPRLSKAIAFVAIVAGIAIYLQSSSLLVSGSDKKGPLPFDAERAYRDLTEIVALGPRVSGTRSSVALRGIIRRELEKAGLEVREFPFKARTPMGERDMVNLVGVVQGTRPEIILLSNHYDTKYLPDIEFVGANDGASTNAWMLEMARALGAKREGYTIWLCFFDGEEAFVEWGPTDGLYGSREMAGRLNESGDLANAKVLINVDMIGDCQLTVFRDAGAPRWLWDVVQQEAGALSHAKHFVGNAPLIEDDHIPFREAGLPAMNLIDYRYGGSNDEHFRTWHTSRDTLDRVCARSLKIMGDIVYRALPQVERALDLRAAKETERRVSGEEG